MKLSVNYFLQNSLYKYFEESSLLTVSSHCW